MAGRKLSAADLEGSEEIKDPAPGRKLSADELAGAVEVQPEAEPAAEKPGVLDRIGSGLARIGRSVATGAKTVYAGSPLDRYLSAPDGDRLGALAAAGAGFVDKLDEAKDPHRRREFERGLDNMITIGYGQQFADWAGRKLGDAPDVQIAATADADRVAAPGWREAGTTAGLALPGVTSAVGKGVVKGVGLATKTLKATSLPAAAVLGAGRAGVSAGVTGGLVGALHADSEGRRLDAGFDAATDPASLALSGALGAVGGAGERVLTNAKGRVDARIESNIARGETGGKAGAIAKKLHAKAESGDLDEVLSRHPDIKKTLATTAASNPAKAAAAVTGRLDDVGAEINPVYKAIDAGPAVPKAGDLHGKLLSLRIKLADAGNTGMADAVERFQNHLQKHYPTDATPLPASALRNMRNEIGEAAFPNGPPADASFAARAKQQIYGAINDTIEDAGRKTPGVDFDRLKTLNKDASALMVVRDTLADRATKGAHGGTSIGTLARGASLLGGGAAAGGLKGALAAAAVEAGIRTALPIARGIDYNLAQRFGRGAPTFSAPAGARLAAALEAARAADEQPLSGPGLESKFKVSGSASGMTEAGNIDLTNRPDVANADGSHSSVRSMSFEENGQEILVPTVSEDGRIMSEDEAIEQYHRTGRHLGKFKTPDQATAYAQRLHEQQAAGMRR